jgi:hypothetical protein
VDEMSYQEKTKSENKHLDSLINAAVKKIGAKKENDICRYLPISTGGYIHHFTMRKMKYENPEQLAQMISKYIIQVDRPSSVTPKPRAARGSRKRRDQFVFTKQDIDEMITMARKAGKFDLIRKLTPKKDLRTIKRELISSIRHGRVEPELWNSYVEAMSHPSTITSAQLNQAAV